jgi:hypothetical protein
MAQSERELRDRIVLRVPLWHVQITSKFYENENYLGPEDPGLTLRR